MTNITNDNFKQEVKDHPGRVLIDFYTPTCPPCRAMAPVLDQIQSERGTSLKIVKIDASIEGGLASEFGVTAVPTFVLLDKGDRKAQLTGLRSKKDFETWIDAN